MTDWPMRSQGSRYQLGVSLSTNRLRELTTHLLIVLQTAVRVVSMYIVKLPRYQVYRLVSWAAGPTDPLVNY